MKMDIYFVRHGESQQNLTKKHQHASIELSEKGAKQAEKLALRLKGTNFDSVFASPHTRAKQTAETIANLLGKTITFTQLLEEIKRPSELSLLLRSDEESELKHMPAKEYWSGRVTKYSNALDLEKGVFTWKDPGRIALSLKKSAQKSTRRKGTPFQSAMSMLNFYINRSGKNLEGKQKMILPTFPKLIESSFFQ